MRGSIIVPKMPTWKCYVDGPLAPRVKWSRGSDGAKALTEERNGGSGSRRKGSLGRRGNRKRLRFAMRSTDENHHLELCTERDVRPGGWTNTKKIIRFQRDSVNMEDQTITRPI